MMGRCTRSLPAAAARTAIQTAPAALVRVNRETGKWKLTADIATFRRAISGKVCEYRRLRTGRNSLQPYRCRWDFIYGVEPNHGCVLSVTKGGTIKQVIDISASEGHIVPTSIAERHGSFYVGNLNLFPIDPQWARILTISRGGFDDDFVPGFDNDGRGYHIVNSKAGFTTVVAVHFGPDGLLYALELSAAPDFPKLGAGKVVRVKRSGEIEDVIAVVLERPDRDDVRTGRPVVYIGFWSCAARRRADSTVRYLPGLVGRTQEGERPIRKGPPSISEGLCIQPPRYPAPGVSTAAG